MSESVPPEVRLWTSLDRVHSILSRQVHNILARHDLTRAQYGVLRRLWEQGPQPANVLADGMGVTPGNLTGVLDRLEQGGLLQRERRDDDRRYVLLRLTGEGERRAAAIVRGVRHDVTTLFTGLEEAEVSALLGLLERLESQLTAGSPEVSA
ncbi:MarR family winged helix-turn-helix transcriptional regulator [Deinococcus apachensis]|uniref:MarR family winged helix-turn-helix transcriptional regulator n=1 Tax=Deinococcus apachensis TaxID=309886 RepID=UPI000362322B|nr:MarR family transcriptional regulator [Deinococcus apachensis]